MSLSQVVTGCGGITGTTIYVDKGYHVMGIAADAVPDDPSK
jgi:enoyl-[acyl-carrier-protein] reductase (NADH)